MSPDAPERHRIANQERAECEMALKKAIENERAFNLYLAQRDSSK